jgi:hypothetical protein
VTEREIGMDVLQAVPCSIISVVRSRASLVGIVVRPRAGQPRSQDSIPRGGKTFFLLQNGQIGHMTHFVSCTMASIGYFPQGKAAGARS